MQCNAMKIYKILHNIFLYWTAVLFQEEEEKIKEALFNGPSPSPTEIGLIEMSPIKILVSSAILVEPPEVKSRTSVSGLAPDTPEKEEEPLAVRVKRLAHRLSSPLTAILEKVEDADTEKEQEQEQEKEGSTVDDLEVDIPLPSDIVQDTDIQSEPQHPSKSADTSLSDRGGPPLSEPETILVKPKTNLSNLLQLDLETVMSKVSSAELQQLSKPQLGLLLRRTVEKHKQVSEFLAQVSVAMATKPDA